MAIYAGSVHLFQWPEKTAYILGAVAIGLSLLGWFAPKPPAKPKAAA